MSDLTDIEKKDLEYTLRVCQETIDFEFNEHGKFPDEPIRVEIEPPKEKDFISNNFLNEFGKFNYRGCILYPVLDNRNAIQIEKQKGEK